MDIFELNIDSYIDPFLMGESFDEFCCLLDEIDNLGAPITEAVKDKGYKGRTGIQKGISNTIDTTGDVIDAYDNMTSANAKLLKNLWDLGMKSINLMVKTSSFIISKVAIIPESINKIIDGVDSLPEKVRSKISGDIQLYISAEDIELVYNQMIINKIDTFIGLSKELSKGEIWGTLFGRTQKVGTRKVDSYNNDINICKKIDKIYNDLNGLKFEPTTIYMKDPKSKEKYFTNKHSIQFKDLKGNQFNGSYYEALKKLMEDLKSRRLDMDEIVKSVGNKYSTTQMNQTFGKLSSNNQNRIIKTIRMISKLTAVIGNIVKYVIVDCNTITKTMKKLSKK